jgi:hypothetical protein
MTARWVHGTIGATIVLAVFGCNASLDGAVRIAVTDLTVPTDRLPDGCSASAAPAEQVSGNRVRGGLWAGLNIPTNPWSGTDRRTIADIRQRVDPSSRLPDGPPLGGGQLAEYHLKLADGVEEGYAAIYRWAGTPDLVTVYGLRLTATESFEAFPAPRKATDASTRIAVGQIVAVASGHGVCFDAISDYLKSLAR